MAINNIPLNVFTQLKIQALSGANSWSDLTNATIRQRINRTAVVTPGGEHKFFCQRVKKIFF